MKFLKFICSSLIFFGVVFPAYSKTYIGRAYISNVAQIGDTEVLGPANLKHVEVGRLITTGPTNLYMVTAKRLAITGSLKFDNLHVAGKSQVTGALKGKDGIFSKLVIVGPARLKDTQIAELIATGPFVSENTMVIGDSDITGSLQAKGSQFQDIEITANKITLKDTVVDNILIRENANSKKQKQKLVLLGKSRIKGDVIFESGRGFVEIDSGSKVDGKIQGTFSGKEDKMSEKKALSFWEEVKAFWERIIIKRKSTVKLEGKTGCLKYKTVQKTRRVS